MVHLKNKLRRSEDFYQVRQKKAKNRLQRRKDVKEQEKRGIVVVKPEPKTIENTRVVDDTLVDKDSEEFAQATTMDDFAQYFVDGLAPSVLVTTCRKPSNKTTLFAECVAAVFPHAKFIARGPKHMMTEVISGAKERNYTDIVYIDENQKAPNCVRIIHLPDGPTFTFKLSSVKMPKDIHNHGNATEHYPELMVNNFTTRLGHNIGRLFSSLFPQKPEYLGRQAVTFHNQRDFIFFRRHRYIFKDGERVGLQEIGPRFTLKLRAIQKGTFDNRYGDYEWKHNPEMDKNRKLFFL